MEDISEKMRIGSAWVFALRAAQQAFTILRLIILARILAPGDFGLMAVALTTMAALDVFSETGFYQALIQSRKDFRPYLNIAWTVSVLRGLLLCGILYAISPNVASFFDSPQAEPIIQAMGLSFLIASLLSPGIVYITREMDFKKQFQLQLAGTATDVIVSVTAALALHNAWALVFGYLAGSTMKTIVSYTLHPYRPRPSLDLKAAKELSHFGKWILGSGALIFLITQGDNIVVGKIIGITALGLYQMAYLISNTPATEVSHVIAQVTFPAYSHLQSRRKELKEAYFRVLQSVAFVALPLAAMIFALAEEGTTIILGSKWLPLVPALRVLCIFGAARALNSTTGSLFQGIGKPKTLTIMSATQLTLMAILIIPLSQQLGIVGASIAVTIPALILLVIQAQTVAVELDCGIKNLIKAVLAPAAATVALAALVLSAKTVTPAGLPGLIILTTLGAATYLITAYLADKTIGCGLMETLRYIIGNTGGAKR